MMKIDSEHFYELFNRTYIPVSELLRYPVDANGCNSINDNSEMEVILDFEEGEVPEHFIMLNPINKVPEGIAVELKGKLEGNIYKFQGYIVFYYEDDSHELVKVDHLNFTYGITNRVFAY